MMADLPPKKLLSPDIQQQLLSLAEAARVLPNRPHVATLWRWSRRGVKGVRLQTVVVGGRRYTTPAYLEDFVAHLNEAIPSSGRPESGRRADQRARAAELAEALF